MYTIERTYQVDHEGLVWTQDYSFFLGGFWTLDQLIEREFKDEIEAGEDYRIAKVEEIEIEHPSSYCREGGGIKVNVYLRLTYIYKEKDDDGENLTRD